MLVSRLVAVAALTLTTFVQGAVAQDGAASPSSARPNILFLFSDDHAEQAIGAYSSALIQTPSLDRLAQEGVLFRNSFCANSICGPSRACILTGKHSHRNGFRRNGQRFNPDQPTFPRMLQGAGYRTAIIGKWHLGTDPVGFDHWEVLPGQGSYYNPDFLKQDGTRQREPGYCTDLITDKALTWLQQRGSEDAPFLLMVQHKAPHRNWAPAPRHLGLFDDVTLPEPATLFDDYGGRSKLLQENEMTLDQHFHWGHDAKFHGDNELPEFFASAHKNGEYARMDEAQKAAWDAHYEPENQAFLERARNGGLSREEVLRWKYQRYLKDYLACVTAVDEGVGRLLDYLDDTGLASNTVVIYSSDQGFYLGEHGWYDKRWMFEESLRMPFLLRWPGVVEPGTESRALIQNIDYAPTFLELAGLEVPADIQGRSLLPLLDPSRAATEPWRDAIYYAYYENAAVHAVPIHDGVRTQRHKLMYFPRGNQWQLFDLQEDPQELQSLHADPAHASTLAALQRRLRDLRGLYGVNSAVIPATRGDEGWWRDRFQAKKEQTAQGDVDLVFLGDSITQSWEGPGKAIWDEYYGGRKALNLGFSGDRTEHALFRLADGSLKAIAPKVVVTMIGTNNTGHWMQDPDQVAEGVTAVIDQLHERWPAAQLVLLGVFPRGRVGEDAGRLNNRAINDRIRFLGARPQVHYRDLTEVFMEADGSLDPAIMPDALHLSGDGYRRWAAALEPLLVELGLPR